MEYCGIIALVLLLCYSAYPGKVKRLESKVKRLEKRQKGGAGTGGKYKDFGKNKTN